MRTHPILRAVVLALLLSPALLPAQGAADTAGTSFQPPERIAGFTLGGTHRYPDPADGVNLRYNGPGALAVDVYLYPAPRAPECAPSCDSVAVDEETSGYSKVVRAIVERGYFDALRIDSDVPLRAGKEPGALRGRHLRMSGTQRGEPRTSHFYLFGGGSYLLKFRATYPPGAAADSTVAAFVTAFAAEARVRAAPGRSATACALGPADDRTVEVSGRFAGRNEALVATVEPALRALGYELDPASPGKGEWTTLPRRTWPAWTEGEKWAGEEHPGLVLRVRAEPKGDSAEVRVSALALCRVAGVEKSGDDLDAGDMLEMMSALELMAKLTGKEKP